MKHFAFFLLTLFACLNGSVYAQQNQQLRRSRSIFLFPEFQEATVRQTFNRTLKAKVNIFLKDASLVFIQDKKVMRAYTNNIIGVVFGDTLRYMKVDSVMARVVAQEGYNYLLCKTTVNMSRYREEEQGGSNLDFFEMSDLNYFVELNQDRRDDDLGIPLEDKYYFNVKGYVIPANESAFKKVMDKGQMDAFKVLMGNRFWSWKDPESLKMLFSFLPK